MKAFYTRAPAVFITTLMLSFNLQAAEVLNFADLAYCKQNTDYEGFGDSRVGTFKGSISAFNWLHARGRYNPGSVNLPSNHQAVQQQSWTVLGLGAHYALNDQTLLMIGSDHNTLSLQKGLSAKGWSYYVGVKHQFNNRWHMSFEVGESNVLFPDTTGAFDLIYKVLPQLGLSATIRDYDDLDLTEYEVGFRWFYR